MIANKFVLLHLILSDLIKSLAINNIWLQQGS